MNGMNGGASIRTHRLTRSTGYEARSGSLLISVHAAAMIPERVSTKLPAG